jgi:hypothetical protein
MVEAMIFFGTVFVATGIFATCAGSEMKTVVAGVGLAIMGAILLGAGEIARAIKER